MRSMTLTTMEALQDPLCRSSEPWMEGTHTRIHVLQRAVVHALEHAELDAERWAFALTGEDMLRSPNGLPSVAFHLLHMSRSLDRLLTYAEDHQLTEEHLRGLTTEHSATIAPQVVAEFSRGLLDAKVRVVKFKPEEFDQTRGVGRKRLPSTVAGLLIHCAEHTQRHSGQMVTTAKLVAQRF